MKIDNEQRKRKIYKRRQKAHIGKRLSGSWVQSRWQREGWEQSRQGMRARARYPRSAPLLHHRAWSASASSSSSESSPTRPPRMSCFHWCSPFVKPISLSAAFLRPRPPKTKNREMNGTRIEGGSGCISVKETRAPMAFLFSPFCFFFSLFLCLGLSN